MKLSDHGSMVKPRISWFSTADEFLFASDAMKILQHQDFFKKWEGTGLQQLSFISSTDLKSRFLNKVHHFKEHTQPDPVSQTEVMPDASSRNMLGCRILFHKLRHLSSTAVFLFFFKFIPGNTYQIKCHMKYHSNREGQPKRRQW